MSNDSFRPLDTIRLSPRDKRRLVDEIQKHSRAYAPNHERRRLRVDYTGNVIVSLKNPDGNTVRYSVTPRNLSTHGLGFIHGQYVHNDRHCEVIIPTLAGEWVLTQACISRCKHLAGLIHDVSLVFDHPINLADFVQLTPEQTLLHHQQAAGSAGASEDTQPAHPTQLAGRVLIAQDIPTDRQLYTMWLQRLGLKISQASSITQACETLDKQNIDVLLIDAQFAGQPGLSLVKQLRLGSFKQPVIVTCDDDSDQFQAQAMTAGANAIIAKPLEMASLHQIVEQLLLWNDKAAVSPDARGKLVSQLRHEPDMLPFIHSFVAELQNLAELLTQARVTKNQQQLVQVCSRIKCGSASYGFSSLTRMAKLALGQIQHHSHLNQIDKALDQLTFTLSRVSVE